MFGKKDKKGDKAPAEGAETEVAEGEEGASKKKGLPLKLVIIGAAGLVLLLGGGGGAAFFLMKPKAEAAEGHGKAGDHGKKKDKKKEKGGHGGGAAAGEKDAAGGMVREGPDGVTFYTMPDLVVNIQGADGRPTFLKLKLTFEMHDHETAELIAAGSPRLQDMFQTFLRELRPEDLNGSQGSYQLRMEILRRVNLVLAPHKVDAVLIEEMLIQ
ncbi:MAG TPA: flagellar basal body-associated FliL family protein [Caulobacteraceae bacterium]|nr:flagellar basal body-associated FliL family protein [Caulobacteraceae bacterium]